MVGEEAVIVAGIGCRRLCPAEAVIALVVHALAMVGRSPSELGAIAVPSFKADEGGLRSAAAHFGKPLVLVAEADLRNVQPLCLTRSAAAVRATGLASVAEAAALAAAGTGARLLLPRIATNRATCALALREPA